MKHAIITRWLANPNEGRRHISHNFWSAYIFFSYQYQSEGFHVH